MAYSKQAWRDYDDTKTENQNRDRGAVVTPERLNHMETGIANSAERAELEQTKQELTSQLAQTGVNVWNHIDLIPNKEIDNQNEWDWTQALQKAIDEAYESGISVVLLPHYGTGDYLTDPISFEGYEGITLKGIGAKIDLNPNYLWGKENLPTNHVRIKFKSSGKVGLQFSDTKENPSWKASQCKVENIWVCGNNLVDTCINGNYGFTLKNVWASHAIYDGVTLEDYTFPALIEDSQLGPNGRHGLYVKGPMTTVYTLRRVNASLNSGYGYYITGGSGINVEDCLAQNNAQGGLKITRRNDLYGGGGSNYLENLTFNNFYAEANGRLENTHADFEGNYALVIDSVGSVNSTGATQARGIVFNGGALNQSATGLGYHLESVYGLTFNRTAVNHNKGLIIPSKCFGLEVATGATSAYGGVPSPFNERYYVRDGNRQFEFLKGGILSTRGRTTAVPFIVDSIGGGESKMMFLSNGDQGKDWTMDAYPVFDGSIVGVKLFTVKSKRTDPLVNGSLKISITKSTFADEMQTGLSYYLQDFLTLDLNTNNYVEHWFEPLEHTIFNEFVGLRVDASSDLVQSAGYKQIVGYLIVEE